MTRRPFRQPIVVPGGEGRSFKIEGRSEFRVIDVEGDQVADLVAWEADGWVETSCPAQTVLFNHPKYRLSPGDYFYSTAGRPMLQIVEDDADGVHDLLYGACNPSWYAALGHPGHANCEDNLGNASRSLAPNKNRRVPRPINLFQNTYPQPDGSLVSGPSPTQSGDGITLRAEFDCVVALTSCAYDLQMDSGNINGSGPTPIRIEFL